jgi:hypothetical protein
MNERAGENEYTDRRQHFSGNELSELVAQPNDEPGKVR